MGAKVVVVNFLGPMKVKVKVKVIGARVLKKVENGQNGMEGGGGCESGCGQLLEVKEGQGQGQGHCSTSSKKVFFLHNSQP